MREFEYKRKVRKALSSPVVLIPMLVVLVFLSRGAWSIYVKNRDGEVELRLARERLAKLEERQATLSAGVEKLQTESGIEGEIRDRFQMAKEGERAVVIVDDPSKPFQPSLRKPSFLQKILNFFTR